MTMLKLLGFLFVVGLAFAVGYQAGREGPNTVVKKAKELGAEVVNRTTTTFDGQHSLHGILVNAKERLIQAKSDLLDKNYGKATSGLEETAQILAQAKTAAEQDMRPKLEALRKKVLELAGEAKSLKAGVLVKLNDAIKDLDALLAR
jgi:hypothetical protein